MKIEIFAARRRRLMDSIGDGVAIVPNAPVQRRNSDVSYPFRSDSDFYYLTGFKEPESVAVLAPGLDSGEFTLFCRERNPEHELWEGSRAGLEGAVKLYGADRALPFASIREELPKLLRDRASIHYCMGRYPEFDTHVMDWMNKVRGAGRSGKKVPGEIVDISRNLHELRLTKTPEEHQTIAKVAAITSDAHVRAMQFCKAGMFEYELQAEIEYWFQKNGCTYAYPSIVASGSNACVLHYTENNKKLQSGDLLLIDAGAELDCYAADITRTFPVNGKFTPEQKSVYEVVLEAQKAAIKLAVKGSRFEDVGQSAVKVISQGLKELGILQGSLEEILETESYKEFYMHKIGHWLGLDVHDVGNYGDGEQSRMLEEGFYMTVEPGIYISPSDEVDARWHGIGIRIEDDVLVTANGNRVTTKAVPKEIAEIEELMSG